MQDNHHHVHDVLILGAGFGGLGMGAQLRIAGLDNFVIVERAARVGGVWRDNAYPGAACDTESHLYCYSFHPHLRVSKMYAGRDELLTYMDSIVEQYQLAPHLRLSSELASARWNAQDHLWDFALADGRALRARFFVPAWGQLNEPLIPPFEGIDKFAGSAFHSAAWVDGVALAGKRVASIGAAASAVQYVPEVAKVAAHLTVFQRSANWIMPRNQSAYADTERDAFAADPALFEQSRQRLHAFREAGFQRTRHGSDAQREGMALALAHLARQVTDPALRTKLTPGYDYACKRILRSDDYYPALTRENVHLETSAPRQFTAEGIVTADGALHRVDVIIFGTGFASQAFQGKLEVRGLDGGNLRARWADGAEAYLGMAVPGFPNMFLIYGPNTNLNHNSIITMLEIQQRYIIAALRQLLPQAGAAVVVDAEVCADFNQTLQANMQTSAFSQDCSSWYKNAAGKVINNWSGTVDEYRAFAGQWRAADFTLLTPAGMRP